MAADSKFQNEEIQTSSGLNGESLGDAGAE